MNIQSLSVDVPAGCPNNCGFCVSKMHHEDYPNLIFKKYEETSDKEFFKKEYMKRLEFSRDNGCNTLLITSTGEPLMEPRFMADLCQLNEKLPSPFKIIELQTSGIRLDDEDFYAFNKVLGISTISLSLSNIFSNEKNAEYNGMKEEYRIDIDKICRLVKENNMNLRLSLNMNDTYNEVHIESIFKRAKELGADQITFRKLYSSEKDTPQDKWIKEHSIGEYFWEYAKIYIKSVGKCLGKLPYGAWKYSVEGISTVIDEDCMSKEVKEDLKYLVLRPNCKLYSKWDDKGSLIF